jgi:hypothetical protein
VQNGILITESKIETNNRGGGMPWNVKEEVLSDGSLGFNVTNGEVEVHAISFESALRLVIILDNETTD